MRLEADNQTIAWMVWNDARAHYQALPYANFAPSPQITKRVETGSLTDVSLGERVTYTIVISNSGDLIANQVVVTDPLPTAVTLGGQIGGSAWIPLPDNVYRWGPYDVASHIPYTIVFTAIVTDNVGFDGKTVTNTAYVSAHFSRRRGADHADVGRHRRHCPPGL